MKSKKKTVRNRGKGEDADLSIVLKPLSYVSNLNWQSLLTAMSMLHLGLLLDNKLFHKRGSTYLRTC